MIKKDKIRKLLGEMQDFAGEHHIPISTSESLMTIQEHIDVYMPKQCLEIGTCIGYGTIAIAEMIHPREGSITSYEISLPNITMAKAYIKRSGLSNINSIFANVLTGRPNWSKDRSFAALETYIGPKKYYDFIYIDGQKSKYLDFLFHILEWTTDDAYILFDDILLFPKKTQALRDRIKANNIIYTAIYHADGDGMLGIWKRDVISCMGT